MSDLTRRRPRAARRPVVESLQQRLLLAAVTARAADAFVDSIGVNTHFSWSAPSPYSFAATLPSLGNSGIRHIRDNLKSSGFAKVSSLYDNYGIRTDIAVDNFDVSIASQVEAMANPWAASIEGANEPDLNSRTYAGLTDGTAAGGTNTYAATKRFQQDLFAAINADPRTANKPVRSPAVGYSVRAPLLGGTDYDEATAHIYPPGTNPDYWRTDAAYLPATNVMNGGVAKPLIVTEAGYTTVNTGDFRVDDATQGKYIPRLLAEYFNRGIARTYLYDFADDGNDPANKENNFGLIQYDGAAKPAYTNLKNMIALLGESTWNTATKQRTTPTFAPGTLDFTLTGDTANVHQLLLQKSNGEFYLMLWNETSSFDGTAPIAVPARNVHLEINTPLSAASRYVLGSTAVQGTYASPQAIDLSVPDSIVVLRLTPGVAAVAAAAPATTVQTFQSDTVNAKPVGWTPGDASDDWQVRGTSSPANQFLENRNASGGRSISRSLGGAVTTSLVADFDYAWRWGGNGSNGNGARDQSIAFELLDASGNGYAFKTFQGTDGDASNNNRSTEIYKVRAGQFSPMPIASGTGFNRAGWQTRGLSAPDWRHARVSWDAATGTLTFAGDPDGDGTFQTLAQASDTSYRSFDHVVLDAPNLSNGTVPQFDNIALATTAVAAVPTVIVRATDRAAGESPADSGTFTFTRTGSTAAALVVTYATAGTAQNGVDYASLNGTVTIPAGAASTTVTVNPIADSIAVAEADEIVTVTVVDQAAYDIGDQRSDDVVITNAAPDFVVSDLTWDANPVAGQAITFRAAVKNVGNVASPTGSLSVYLYTDVSSIAFAGTVLANTSIAAGGSLVFTIVPSSSVVWSAGNQVVTAWVDRNANFWPSPTGAIAERSDLNNQTFKVLAVASGAVGSSFNSATVGQPPPGFTTGDDGWVVKNDGGQNFLENATAGTGTRSITQAFPSAHAGSWAFDFKHTWRWGGSTSTGNGFRSLSVSSDIVDAAGNGVRVRAYQGNGGSSAYDGALVEIYIVTNGVAAATPIATGGGFNRPGWKSVGQSAPDWRSMRVTFDRGTRKLSVLADLTGTGQYQRVAGAVLTSAPATFSKYTLNAEGLANSVAPEFDDLRMTLLP